MKHIEIKKHWIVIFWLLVALIFMLTEISVRYYGRHFMDVKIWRQRLNGGNIFYAEGMKIITPKDCATQSSRTTSEIVVDSEDELKFICVISSVDFEFVYLRKSIPDANELQKIKDKSEKFVESEKYVHSIIGPKIGLSATSFYYMKHQNITVASDSEQLAQEFANLLTKYDLRVGMTIPLDKPKHGS